MVFVDTSALYALLDADDAKHKSAASTFEDVLENDFLMTHSYVVVEVASLVQRRLDAKSLRSLFRDLLPAVTVEMVAEGFHQAAISALLAGPKGGPSMVDLVSFELMRQRSLAIAFAFDRHFEDAGFELLH